MNSAPEPAENVRNLLDGVSGYLPTLVAGLAILAVGIVAGWIVQRAVIRVLVWLRLDRLGGRFGWRAALGRGDTRAALYRVAGSIAMVLVILIFLDNAVAVMGLTVLSRLLDQMIGYLPRVAVAFVIVAVGLALARAAGERVERALEDEEFPRARLAGKICRAAVVIVVAALTLWELDFARQIVLAGFVLAFGSVAVAFALGVGLGSVRAIQKGWEGLLEPDSDSDSDS